MTTQVFDPDDGPARLRRCVRCLHEVLLAPGGCCADCIAEIGLAEDKTEHTAWRRRVEEETSRK